LSACVVTRDGIALAGVDVGEGIAVAFQHGLGGDNAQVARIFPSGFRRLTLECRGQGKSEAGDPAAFSFQTFAEDVIAFLDQRGVASFVVGGVSMGAALALRIAVKYPRRVRGLILVRPAWLFERAPETMRPNVEVARFLLAGDRAGFEASATARRLMRDAPDNLASLRTFFDRPDPAVFTRLLAAIADDGPGVEEAEVGAIRAPALAIGNAMDAIHPIDFARRIAQTIPGARFVEATAKALDPSRHAAEVSAAIAAFLSSESSPP
jgi:pimeloyl-ACP methyl ester carboxylesterase